jgi:hypothetical protein
MSVKASSVARQAFGGMISVYFEDDRVEVGNTSAACQEALQRVAYRDVKRIVSWPDQRRGYFYVGGALTLFALVGVLVAFGMPEVIQIFTFIGAGVGLVFALSCLFAGRPGGITGVRIEGLRGSVDAVLAGSARKRARVLAELERRVRVRQSTH